MPQLPIRNRTKVDLNAIARMTLILIISISCVKLNADVSQGFGVISHSETSFRAMTGSYVLNFNTDMDFIEIDRIDAKKKHMPLSLIPGGGDSDLLVLASKNIRTISVKDEPENVDIRISGQLDWAEYTCSVMLYRANPGLINTRIEIVVNDDRGYHQRLFSGDYPELSFHAADNKYTGFLALSKKLAYYFNGTPGSLTHQSVSLQGGAIPDLNQFIFFGDPVELKSSLFYFVDFTSLNPYFKQSGTMIFDTVRQPPGCLNRAATYYMDEPADFGFDIPTVEQDLEKGSRILVTNSWLCLTPTAPGILETVAYSKRFIENLASVYPYLEKPATKYIDWPDIYDKAMDAMAEYVKATGKEVLSFTNINSCKRYAEAFQNQKALKLVEKSDEIMYTTTHARSVRAIATGDYADQFKSEKILMKFLDSSDSLMEWGQHQMTRTDRHNHDEVGGYLYTLLLYYKFTREDKYLAEAKAAADRVLKSGFEFPYEFFTTPVVPVAMLRLYKLTGEDKYLQGSYIPLAACLRHSWFFNPQYREYQGRTVFLLTEGMPGVYANGWEESAMMYYLYLYLVEGRDELMPEAIQLTSELLRYKCTSLADSLPPLLPDKSIIYTGKPREWHMPVRLDWYLPVEGFGYLEWDKTGLHDRHGRVSQGTYNVGALPEAAMLQFHRLSDNLFLYVETPIRLIKESDSKFSFELLTVNGIYKAGCGGDRAQTPGIVVRAQKTNKKLELKQNPDIKILGFSVKSGEKYSIQLNKYRR